MNQTFIYLASGSPRRGELLSQIGVEHRVRPAHIDESQRPDESVVDYVQRMAHEKATAVAAKLGRAIPVLAADTVVMVDDVALGKPANREQGVAMLETLSNRSHHVLTAVAMIDKTQTRSLLSKTKVAFRKIARSERERYWETGEPVDKAGGYAIQGHAAVFVEHIEGSYSGVMGLPLFETAQLLRLCGVRLATG